MNIQGISERALAGDAHFFDEVVSPATIRENLASNKDSDKLAGMKFLLASLSKGRETSHFFADVVKNVAVKNFEVKKMVYIYLVHYADYNNECRELALLSINTFQNDMSGHNELFRAMALRVLTSINVEDIVAIQILAARKCSSDASPYVRKCAATALAKLYAMSYGHLNCHSDNGGGAYSEADSPGGDEVLLQLKDILAVLLADPVPMVLGSALLAYNSICPNDFNLLHKHYRKICHLVCDLNEWTQVAALDVLTRYVRTQFTNPARKFIPTCGGGSEGDASNTAKSAATAASDSIAVASTEPTVPIPQYTDSDFDLFGLPTTASSTSTTANTTSAATRSGKSSALSAGRRKPPVKAKVARGFYSDDSDDAAASGGDAGDSSSSSSSDDEVDGGNLNSGTSGGHTSTWNHKEVTGFSSPQGRYSDTSSATKGNRNSQQWYYTGYTIQDTELDSDYLLVLKSTSPLLRSCNASVILAVCTLHFHCCNNLVIVTPPAAAGGGDSLSLSRSLSHSSIHSHGLGHGHSGLGNQSSSSSLPPRNSLYPVAKALIRILRNRREVQYILLQCIRDMATIHPVMFKDYVPSFYSTHTEPLFIRLLKLEILGIVSVCLSVEECRLLLCELQVYIRCTNAELVCAACAVVTKTATVAHRQLEGQGHLSRESVSDVVSTCIQGMVHLLLTYLYTPAPAVPTLSGYTVISDCDNDAADSSCVGDVSVVNACLSSIRSLAVLNKHVDLTLKVVQWLVKELLTSIHPASVIHPRSVSLVDHSSSGNAHNNSTDGDGDGDGDDDDDARDKRGHGLSLRYGGARADVVLIISSFRDLMWPLMPDIIRCLAHSYIRENTGTKLQIMNLAIKVHLDLSANNNGGNSGSGGVGGSGIGITTTATGVNGHSTSSSIDSIPLTTQAIVKTHILHILELSRYDQDFDLRDRARVLTAMMGLRPVVDTKEAAMLALETELNLSGVGHGATSSTLTDTTLITRDSSAQLTKVAEAVLCPSVADLARVLGPPPARCTSMPSNSNSSSNSARSHVAAAGSTGRYIFGSLSHMMKHEVRGYRALQPWQSAGSSTGTGGTGTGAGSSSSSSKSRIGTAKSCIQTSLSTGLRNNTATSATLATGSNTNKGDDKDRRPKPYRDPTSLHLSDSSSSDNDDDAYHRRSRRSGGEKGSSRSKGKDSGSDSDSGSNSSSYSSGSYYSYTGSSDYSGDSDSSEDDVPSPRVSTSHAVVAKQQEKQKQEKVQQQSTVSRRDANGNGNGLISLLDEPAQYAHLSPSAAPVLSQEEIYNQFIESFVPGTGAGMGATTTAATTTATAGGNGRSPPSDADINSLAYTHTSASPLSPSSPLSLSTPRGGDQKAEADPNPNPLQREEQVEWVSDSLVLLRPELSSGLSVALVYIRKPPTGTVTNTQTNSGTGSNGSGLNAASAAATLTTDLSRTRVYIVVQNRREEHPIRRIRISFARELQTSGIPDIPLLPPGRTIKLAVELNLSSLATASHANTNSANASYRVDIRCESGSYTGYCTPGARECLVPSVMTHATCAAILAKGSKGGGFNVSTKTFTGAQLTALWEANLSNVLGLLPPNVSGVVPWTPGARTGALAMDTVLPKLLHSMFNTHSVAVPGAASAAASATATTVRYFTATIRRGNREDKVIFQCTFTCKPAVTGINAEDNAAAAVVDDVEIKLYSDDVLQCTSFLQFLASSVKGK